MNLPLNKEVLNRTDWLSATCDELDQLLTQAHAALDLATALENLLLEVSAPEPNCSCHINPPCGDCERHGALREFIKDAKRVLENIKPPVASHYAIPHPGTLEEIKCPTFEDAMRFYEGFNIPVLVINGQREHFDNSRQRVSEYYQRK